MRLEVCGKYLRSGAGLWSLLGFALVLGLPLPGLAGTFYVRAGAAGQKNGLDWNNAFPQLPAVLVRGSTYYVADGSYPGCVFSTPESGTQTITVKKAIATNHGTEVGWRPEYGDGKAVFGPLQFKSSYWVIDGQVGGGPGKWTSGHGFKIEYKGAERSRSLFWVTGPDDTNIVGRHIEMVHAVTAEGQDGVYTYGNKVTLQYCWIHKMGRCCIMVVGADNLLVEYSLLEENGLYAASGRSTEHSEIMMARPGADGGIVRYNCIRDFRSTGAFILTKDNRNWDFYGNVFYGSGKITSLTANHGVVSGLSPRADGFGKGFANIRIFNNTLVNLTWGGAGRIWYQGQGTGIVVRNNLLFNCPNAKMGGDHDYNWFYNSGGTFSERNAEVGTRDPFVNLPAQDFRLRAATRGGAVMSAPYNRDMWGAARGGDGCWDRGATELNGAVGDSTAPRAPSNVRTTRAAP